MKLYLVFGDAEVDDGLYTYTETSFYGAFISKERAEEIKKRLDKVEQNVYEDFRIDVAEIDEPTDIYYLMITD